MIYLDDYVDTIQALPEELAKNFTQIKELDAGAQDAIKELKTKTSDFLTNVRGMSRHDKTDALKHLTTMIEGLIKHGEDKVKLASTTYNLVDQHIRRLDEDLAKYEEEQLTGPRLPGGFPNTTRMVHDVRQRQEAMAAKARNGISPMAYDPYLEASRKRKEATRYGDERKRDDLKKRKVVKKVDYAPIPAAPEGALLPQEEVDPSEPTYCTCNRVSFGEMIACDNEECEIEWFHYECVGLTAVPKGKWYCPTCTKNQKKR